MGKRGLSAVVTTLIMILLTLVTVGMIWLVVMNILKSSADEADIGKLTLKLGIEKVKVEGEDVSITVKRSPGKGEMTSIKFVLKNGTDSVIVVKEGSLVELELKTFIINTTQEGITLPITKISMYAITKTGTGKEVPGLEYKYDVGTGLSPGGQPGCVPITEICGNGIDEDCDGSDLSCSASCTDNDGDGYGNPGDTSCSNGAAEDCNDNDPKEKPGQTWYNDQDQDKYSNATTIVQCNRPANYNITSELSGINDCNNTNSAIYPGATEVCNSVDDNCDSLIDEGGVCGGPLCNDGTDNDADGKVDYPNDIGCSSLLDNDESDVTFLKTWNGLVSWWRMNGNYNDEIGLNNGICTNCPTYNSSGKYGGAYQFDGMDDSINISSTKDDINFKNKDFSILLWEKTNTFTSDNGYSRRMIVLKNGTFALDFAVYTSTNPIAFRINNTDRGYISGSLNTGVWYNIALTRNSSGYYIFVDGINKPITPGGMGSSSSGTAEIGRTSGLTTSGRFNGTIDEVMIFNRSLSASEVSQIYTMNLSSG